MHSAEYLSTEVSPVAISGWAYNSVMIINDWHRKWRITLQNCIKIFKLKLKKKTEQQSGTKEP